jgi:hypothetical protein
MFWGAPLIAREFETGGFRLAWTQGVTRTRWLAVKLGLTGLASMSVAGLLSLMVTWWSSPIAAVDGGRLSSFRTSGAWILSTQLINPDGHPGSTIPATRACGPNVSSNSCEAYIESLHLRQTVTYQPASRYWPLQWYETGIYLAVALALASFCLWRIRPARSAGPDIHHPRASRPAPALERTP